MRKNPSRKGDQRGPHRQTSLSWRKKAVYACIPLLLLLGTTELVCRLFPYRKSHRQTRAGTVRPDPDLIWSLKPYATGACKTNRLNLCDTPYNAQADVKILLLGDSVSWGDGVDMKSTYAYQLEQRLNALDGPTTYEVINAGVPGYSTFQEADYLELRGLALEPDMVVLQFCLNDVVERYKSLASYGGDNIFLGIDTRATLSGTYGALWRHSRAFERFARYLQSRSRRREEYEVRKMAQDELSPELEEAWGRTLDEIDEIRTTAAENDLPFLLVVAPYRFQLSDPDLRQPQDRLLTYAASHDVNCVDLLPAFSKASSSYPLFRDRNHFTVFGHTLASKLLIKPVLDMLESAEHRDENS